LGVETFIETGTYDGPSCEWASHQFKRVITIEVNPAYQQKARERCKDRLNIEFFLGNSADVLPIVMKSVHDPALFWLDAHTWPGLFGPQLNSCPLIQELQTINQSPCKHCILIDDAQDFNLDRRSIVPANWPTIPMIKAEAENGGYQMRVEDSLIVITK